MRLLLLIFSAAALRAQSSCGSVGLSVTTDYQFAIGTSSGGSAYTWTANGQPFAQGAIGQLELFHFDNGPQSTSGISPVKSTGVSYVPGKWGSALALAPGGTLSYPVPGNLSFQTGTIEMWIAPRQDGASAAYAQYNALLLYTAPNGDDFRLVANAGRTFTAGTVVNGKFAGAGGGDVSHWKAGEWHHLAFTYSVNPARERLYVDGQLISESLAVMPAPATGGSVFTIGNSVFLVDELRIANNEKSASNVLYDATRASPFADNEVVLALSGVPAGQLTYSVNGCGTASYNFAGVPITNFSPPSGLLATGSTTVTVAFNTVLPTTCRYAAGNASDYASMQPLDTGPAATAHKATVGGLSSDPRILNQVYVRCAANPDYLQTAVYRAVAAPSQAFPRIGNIWLGDYVYRNAPANARKIQLYLGTNMSAATATALRAANLNVLILTLPTVGVAGDGGNLSDDYYLKDVHGNKIANWCGPPLYTLNITKPEVAQFIGKNAYQQLGQSTVAFDGLFFDEFSTTIKQPFTDCYGNVVQIDANGDGIADDPAALNAAWAAGMYQIVSTFRTLAPSAYVSGHVITEPGTLSAFNGTSTLDPVFVREGTVTFGTLWNMYQTWETQSIPPMMMHFESAPPSEIAYGYGYYPLKALLPATIDFAQSFYPNMRFGLAFTLMSDGFFSQDFGDTGANSPVTWWYDEYDFALGYPLGPAVQIGSAQAANIVRNGDFESSLVGTWELNVVNDGQARGSVALDTTVAADGNSSAHIDISSVGTVNSHIDLAQVNLPLIGGAGYQVQFWARADSPRVITLILLGGPPNFANYGLNTKIAIGTSWKLYSASFTATATATDGRLEFLVGDISGGVWLDDVRLTQSPADIYRRDFTSGVVLLNGTASPQTIPLESGLRRYAGSQAPLYQYIVDDSSSNFSSSGQWNIATSNTGSYSGEGSGPTLPPKPQNANGPYYHAWQGSCHQLDSSSGSAQWKLSIPADGRYTIQAWLPAAPGAASWTKNAVYEIVSGGSVVATATLDQTIADAGDSWHTVAALDLTAAGSPFVRLHNGGSGSLIADAVYVTSAALYNDGSPAPQVNLAPMDGILLQRQQPVPLPASRVSSVVNGAGFQAAIASAGFVSIVGTGFSNSARSWASADFSGNNLPLSLDGISVTINNKPAYVEYVNPTQINAIAPDDDTVGPVQVQVTTPQGASYTATVLKQKLSPAFFAYQAGTTSYAAAVHTDGTLVGPSGPVSRPAAPGEVIEIYGTGFGATSPVTDTSQLVSQPAPLVLPATVTIGGIAAEVQWAGLVSSGFYQLNVKIPNLAPGDQPVQATVSGFQSPATVMLTMAGQ